MNLTTTRQPASSLTPTHGQAWVKRGLMLVALPMLAAGAVWMAMSPPSSQPTSAPSRPEQKLLPDPQIINVHEHLQNDPKSIAAFHEANRRVGITATGLQASSRFTFRLDKSSFVEHHENNAFLCDLARRHPAVYYAFVTFDPLEEDMVVKLKEYLEQGATGVKLYLGHGSNIGDGTPFHRFDLDDKRMLPLYDFCQTQRVPILFHVNLRKYEAEFRRVMSAFPRLPVILPHFGLKLGKLDELEKLLKDYPHLVIDISFGETKFQYEGFERVHKNLEKARKFILDHQDRILFGTDVVLTPQKSVDFVVASFIAYRHVLELETYDFDQVDVTGVRRQSRFKGLALSESVLRKIYCENFLRMMAELTP